MTSKSVKRPNKDSTNLLSHINNVIYFVLSEIVAVERFAVTENLKLVLMITQGNNSVFHRCIYCIIHS